MTGKDKTEAAHWFSPFLHRLSIGSTYFSGEVVPRSMWVRVLIVSRGPKEARDIGLEASSEASTNHKEVILSFKMLVSVPLFPSFGTAD